MGDVHHLPPLGREFFIDGSDTVLRVTSHLDQSLVNLSVWRGNRCTETFQLPLADVSRLIAYLAEGLGSAAAAVTQPSVVSAPAPPERLGSRLRRVLHQLTG